MYFIGWNQWLGTSSIFFNDEFFSAGSRNNCFTHYTTTRLFQKHIFINFDKFTNMQIGEMNRKNAR